MKIKPEYNDSHPTIVQAYSFFCKGCKRDHLFFVNGGIIWDFNGNMDAPTFSPSLLNIWDNNKCHLFLTDGKIQYLNDCTHELAGQTIELQDQALNKK